MPETLKPAVFHILLALADADRHGYAIMQTVRDQSEGRVPLQTGSLYRHLSTLLDEGLVVEVAGPKHAEDVRRGTHYRLTPPGRKVLEQERAHLARLLSAMNALKPTTRRNG